MTMELSGEVVDQEALRAALLAIESLVEQDRLAEAQVLVAPLAERHPQDFWVGRMLARATADDTQALRRWHGLMLAFPNEPQSHIDLAAALRRHARDHGIADAILTAAQQRFPDHLWLLDALAIAAERRGDDEGAAAWWRRLAERHPQHVRAQEGLVAALARLQRTEALDSLPIDPLGAVRLRQIAQAEADPEQALAHWSLLRSLHPRVAAGAIGTVAALRALGRGAECDVILAEAREALPEDPEIAVAWTHEAIHRQDFPQALVRAQVLRALAPEWLETALFEADALIETGDPEAALPILAAARKRFPEHFWLAYHEVKALNQLGRWQAAQNSGRALFDGFPQEPLAAPGLAEALIQLGRDLEAEAVLREAHQRFPQDRGLTLRLAEVTAARDAAAAIELWRAAGLPENGTGPERQAFAMALARSGQLDEAEALLAGVADRWHRLGLARLQLAAGRIDEALAAWHDLTPAFTLAEADFAALTWSLASTLPDAQAQAVLRVLVEEPDSMEPDWIPALGRALAATAAEDPVLDRLRAALAAPGPDTLARAIAATLTGERTQPDALAERMLRAIADARPEIVALLLENAGDPQRTARLRLALRLAINRVLGAETAIRSIPPGQVRSMLTIARVADPECFDYIATLARARFVAALPPLLPRDEDVVGCMVHRRLRQERGAPGPELGPRLAVALCVHGHAPRSLPEMTLVRRLRLEAHDVRVFAHVWHSTLGAAPPAEAALDRLPRLLRRALQTEIDRQGTAAVTSLYPLLMSQQRPAPPVFEPASVRARYGGAELAVEDADAPHLHGRSQHWRARYKAMLAHQMAARSGIGFDLVLHVAAESEFAASDDVDWRRIAQAARDGGVVFAEAPLHFRRGTALAMGESLVAGARAEMDIAAESFSVAEFAATGQASIAGLPLSEVHRHSQPMLLHLMGVPVATLAGVGRVIPATTAVAHDPIAPGKALGLLWKCFQARPAHAADVAVLRAALADSTYGVEMRL